MQGICFLDIEVVPQHKGFFSLQHDEQRMFMKRFRSEIKNTPTEDVYLEKAGLTAEFGRICAFSTGTMVNGLFYVKKYASTDEVELLKELGGNIEAAKVPISKIGGHNIIEFDCPIAMRRYIANGMTIPKLLNSMGVKSWDLPYRDTMKMWSGSEWNHRVGIETLCWMMGIDNPKEGTDGSDVVGMFDRGEFQKIKDYCAGDMIASAKIYSVLVNEPKLRNDQVVHLN